MSLPPSCPTRELFELCVEYTSRALAVDPDSNLPSHGTEPGPIQLPASDLPGDNFAAARGVGDTLAMKIRYHDESLHQSMKPAGPLSRSVFDALEQLRIDVCASRAMTGVAANLCALFEHILRLRGLSLLENDAATPLSNALVLTLRRHLLTQPLPENANSLVSRWHERIVELTGCTLQKTLEAMRSAVHDQAKFSRLARELISSLELVDDPEKGSQAKPAETATSGQEGQEGFDPGIGADNRSETRGEERVGEEADSSAHTEADEEDDSGPSRGDTSTEYADSCTVIAFPKNSELGSVVSESALTEGTPNEPGDQQQSDRDCRSYQVYTTRFDEVVPASNLVSRDQLGKLRSRLDREISDNHKQALKLASRLQNSFRTLQKRTWTYDLDDGLLDNTRLSRLVTDPTSPLAFKQDSDSHSHDTVVSFLVDNSGSMRGRPITLAAMFVDILARTLERCGVATEILGFTTCRWRGGYSGKQWREKGCPANPGRLSEARHLVYKNADEPWRKARRSLGVMLWPELLKENIDGEALLWAHGRLLGRQQHRRILVVISDGVPADDATRRANGDKYLVTHLRDVVHWIETRSPIELIAIGTGHDVSSIYRRSVTINDIGQLGDAIAQELIELLANVPGPAHYPFVSTTIAG